MYLTKHTLQASHYFFHTTYLIGQGPVLHLKYCYLLCFLSCTKINYFSINHPHMVVASASSVMGSWLENCSCPVSHILVFDYLSHVKKSNKYLPLSTFSLFRDIVSMYAQT